jgi:hypothetical protein
MMMLLSKFSLQKHHQQMTSSSSSSSSSAAFFEVMLIMKLRDLERVRVVTFVHSLGCDDDDVVTNLILQMFWQGIAGN